MTEASPDLPGAASGRFPIGLTVASAIGIAILISLGVWQLQRLTWKEGVLAHIAALRQAPAVDHGPVLVASCPP